MSYMSYWSALRPAWVVLAVAGAFALALSATAGAAPTKVNLRVEGSTTTLFEGVVTSDTNKPDGDHTCNGPSPTSALFDVTQKNGIAFAATWWPGFGDYVIDRIGSDMSGDFVHDFHWWSLWVNNSQSMVGGCQVTLTGSDTALWAYVESEDTVLGLQGPNTVMVGEPFQVEVKKYDTQGSPSTAQGASLSVGGQSYTTGRNGRAAITISNESSHTYKASLPGSVRSNAVSTCAYLPGSRFCDTVRAEVQIDNIAPLGRVLWPSKKRYRRGPRVLKGYVRPDPSGLKAVKIRLIRKTGRKNRVCRGFNFRRERFSVRCSKSGYKKVGDRSSWAYQLPGPLAPGLYRLDVKAVDGADNVSRLKFGQSRKYFRVLNRR